MRTFIKTVSKLTLTLSAALLLAAQALALDISSLKDQGVVGELDNGYVGIVIKSPDSELVAYVNGINTKRKSIYESQAKKNNLSLAEVEAIAAKRNLDKTSAGHYISVDGVWKKK
ncbi:MAG: YdbL family protein [Kangiellaceae bacterium]|nr:YdbL family protein [Kangiellaceae bacterium]